MAKKFIAVLLVGSFGCALFVTVWKACGFKTKNARFFSMALLDRTDDDGHTEEAVPCVSLKSAYDFVSTLTFSGQPVFQYLFPSKHSIVQGLFVGGVPVFSGLSPPFSSLPDSSVPIFQLNSNLRI